ncbi:MAG: aspartate--tRNA(Asn) ligase [Candidatus Micrarchaeota archaeon]
MLRTHYVSEVGTADEGKDITLAGWVHETRTFGPINFVILRDRTGLMQIILKKGETPEPLIEKAKKLVKEAAIVVKGKVRSSKMANLGRELVPESIDVVGEVLKQVPFEITGKVPADLDVRLDKRFIDLRRIETQAVFRVRSEIQRAFREKLLEQKFQEINPPSLVEAATEGGTDLFEVKYFEKKAFLAQSPQLYKQLAVMGGMDKVFMICPIWRAEKHNTTQHLNEITQMDIEMGFADDKDALDALEKVFLHILNSVKKNCADALKTLSVELNVPKEIKRHTYTELVDLLSKSNFQMKWGDDFSKENEGHLQQLLNEEAFIITEWPTAVRAFYSMPLPDNPKICKAYDLMYRGLEIASGAQRIHIPDLLVKQLKAKEVDPKNFESYIDAFRYGAIPHAGWSIGSERLTMKLCNLQNIREASLFPRDRNRLLP